jgi:sugar phosphate isomerase/epimerase
VNTSRRSFLKASALSLPLAYGFAGSRVFAESSAASGVRFGVQTYSFRDMLNTPGDMADKMIAAIQELGLTECEVFEPTLQPPALSADAPWRMIAGKPTKASLMGAPPAGAPTVAQLANREAIRQWRLGPGLDDIKAAAEKFQRAGIRVLAFNYTLKDGYGDDEIERGLQMTRALGTDILAASTTLTMAKRVVPLFEKHKVLLSVHGHSNLSDPNQFATPESFAKALAMSSYYRVNLDVGHFAASGFDPVDYIRRNHASITHLHIKDRKKNNGANMPLGQGDTPVAAILQLLKKEAYPIPAYIEYEYAGAGTSTQEVGRCLEYAKSVLA